MIYSSERNTADVHFQATTATIGHDGSFVLTDDQLEQILQECEYQHMAGGAGGVTTNAACSNYSNCNVSVNSWCWNWSSCQTSANFGGPCS